jgi:hypothetical protein
LLVAAVVVVAQTLTAMRVVLVVLAVCLQILAV